MEGDSTAERDLGSNRYQTELDTDYSSSLEQSTYILRSTRHMNTEVARTIPSPTTPVYSNSVSPGIHAQC